MSAAAELFARVQLAAVAGGPYRRPLTKLERQLDLAGIDRGLDRQKAQLVAEVKRVCGPALERAATGGAFAPPRGPIAAALVAAGRIAYGAGQAQVRHEAAQQRGERLRLPSGLSEAGERAVMDWMRQQAEQTARDLVSAMVRRMTARRRATGKPALPPVEREAPEAVAAKLGDALDGSIRAAGSLFVMTGQALGRRDTAQEYGASTAQYSCLLDASACDPCQAADGMEFPVDSDDYDYYQPPFQDCDGGDMCRCLYVFDLTPIDSGDDGDQAEDDAE